MTPRLVSAIFLFPVAGALRPSDDAPLSLRQEEPHGRAIDAGQIDPHERLTEINADYDSGHADNPPGALTTRGGQRGRALDRERPVFYKRAEGSICAGFAPGAGLAIFGASGAIGAAPASKPFGGSGYPFPSSKTSPIRRYASDSNLW